MYSNGQWPGHGQQETIDIFQPLVEITPQLHVGKILRATRSVVSKLTLAVRSSNMNDQASSQEAAVSS